MAASVPRPLVCDLRSLGADAETIDLLARLQLAARRHGRALRFPHASPALQELIAFVGLDAVLRVEPGREAEKGEDPLGVEEERQLDDPAV
ncbi:MAG: STAS domain-containing protein [Actinobacteria bacterium]|nr:MAG: STAS domain-containing protein [Actinomycetota bacterium]